MPYGALVVLQVPIVLMQQSVMIIVDNPIGPYIKNAAQLELRRVIKLALGNKRGGGYFHIHVYSMTVS